MRSTQRLLVGGLAAVAFMSTAAVPAFAQEATIVDKRADVVQYDGDEDTSGTTLDGPASIATGIDATSARVKHTTKNVGITMRFANLTDKRVFTYAGIRIKGHKTWPTYWIYNNGSSNRVTVYNRNVTKALCTGTLSRRNGASGTISIRVSRSCLGKPKEIKVQTGVVRLMGSLNDSEATFYDESLSSTKVVSTSSTAWLKAS